jgi:hypothetical protein
MWHARHHQCQEVPQSSAEAASAATTNHLEHYSACRIYTPLENRHTTATDKQDAEPHTRLASSRKGLEMVDLKYIQVNQHQRNHDRLGHMIHSLHRVIHTPDHELSGVSGQRKALPTLKDV